MCSVLRRLFLLGRAAALGSISWVAAQQSPNDDPAIGIVRNPAFLSGVHPFFATGDASGMPEAVTLPEVNWIVPEGLD